MKVYDVPSLGAGGARQGAREPDPARARGSASPRSRRPADLPGGPLPPLRDEERAREEDGPLRLREPARGGDHRDQPRGGGRAPLRPGSPTAARQVFLGTRDGMGIKFSETDVRPIGPRHDGGQGDRAARGGRRRRDGPRRRGGDAPRRHRARLRQADRRRRVPAPDARRHGRHQREGDREERPRRRDQVGRRTRTSSS